MADLHAIEPEPLAPGLVELVEQVRDLVAAGGVSSVAVAIVHRDGTMQALWTEAPSMGLLIGSATRLVHKLNMDLDA